MTALEKWIRDFRHAARGLARTPGFTLTVVVTLALAIGANAAIFSVVKPVLLDRGPFPHADRLVHIGGAAPGTEQPEEFGVADELYFEYRESLRVPYSSSPSVMPSDRAVATTSLSSGTFFVFPTTSANGMPTMAGG